ncbi:MAG: hypothetical protein QXK76_00480 [Candidatus Woesearchaeota archaeon]
MNMRFKKKAVLMTIAALLISALFFIMFSGENILPVFYTSQPLKTRVLSVDSYIKLIPVMLSDALEVSTYKSLNGLYIYYSKIGTFPEEDVFYKNLVSCIKCGKLDCNYEVLCPYINGTDFENIIINFKNLSDNHMNIITTITINNILIEQKYPFDIDVTADVSYSVYDPVSNSRWERRENITRIVSIIGLKDPLSGINTAGSYEITIKKSSICTTAFQNNAPCWDINKVKSFYDERSFIYSPNATSFLSRYWNSTIQSECCGIETFIHIDDIRNVSYLDHYYFSGEHTCLEDTILSYGEISPNFKLDSKTAGRYSISDEGVLICRR